MERFCSECGRELGTGAGEDRRCPVCTAVEEYGSLPLDLDEDEAAALSGHLMGFLEESATAMAAKSRAVWFQVLAERALREQPGPAAAELLDLAVATYQLIQRYEQEQAEELLDQVAASIDSGLRQAAEQGLITAAAAADLALLPLTWEDSILFMTLITRLPDGDVALAFDLPLLDWLAGQAERPPAALASSLEVLERHHLLLNLTPAHPLGSGRATVAVNPMISENADAEMWERSRQRWREYLTRL